MSDNPASPPLFNELSIPELDHDRNLAFVLSLRDRFGPSKVTQIVGLRRRRVPVAKRRTSFSIEGDPEVDAACASIESHILPRADSIVRSLGGAPFPVGKSTYACVCYRDGAYFTRHIDGLQELHGRRRLSWVYYLHSKPRRFQGGTLRLHGPDGASALIEPVHGKIVVFRSEIYHEVTAVELPRDEFQDARFTLNGFIHDRATLRDKMRYYATLGRRTARFVREKLRGARATAAEHDR